MAMVEFLIERGADVKASAMDAIIPLHFAAQNGHTLIVKALLEQTGKQINERGTKRHDTPLQCAYGVY